MIYSDKYNNEEKELQKCIDRARALGHEEYKLLNEALGHRDTITFMLERASYLHGFRDVIKLVSGMPLD